MKSAPRFVCLATLALVAPFGCTSVETQIPVGNLCAQVPSAEYEFKVLSDGSTENFYSFEPDAASKAIVLPGAEALLVDDDDLTDDYPFYLKGLQAYDDYLKKHPDVVSAITRYEARDPDNYTAEQKAEDDAALAEIRAELQAICWNYGGFAKNDRPELGVKPMFLSCKDKYDESGDGVIGWWNLASSANPEDKKLAACGSLSGTANSHAVNFWGPVSTYPQGVAGPDIPFDGFNFSGMTVPLQVATYKQTTDASQYEGIGFWARQATADEGMKLDNPDVIRKPSARKNVSPDARAQDGVSQIGVIIQTVDTSAFKEDLGSRLQFSANSSCQPNNDLSAEACSCFTDNKEAGAPAPCAGASSFASFSGPLLTDDTSGAKYKYGALTQYGLPVDIPQPFCIDYSPVDSVPGKEAPFREQCWDGFRTMVEVGAEWRFYMLPFSEMRQAGWGAYAKAFRTDQVRSINFLASAFQATNVIIDEVAFYKKK